MNVADLRQLLSVVEQLKTRDIAQYSLISTQRKEIQNRIKHLQDNISGNNFSDEYFDQIAAWQRWAELEKQKLNERLHRLSDEEERSKIAAQKALAKVRSVEILLERSLRKELVENRKRAEQYGMPPDA